MSEEYVQEEEYLKKALLLTEQLKAARCPLVDPATISLKSKIPSKAMCLREVMHYRVSDLAEAALSCYQKDQFVASAILTRAILESFALLYWLVSELEHCIAGDRSTNDIDGFLKRALLGTRNELTPLPAHQVLKAIDVVAKDVGGYRRLYEDLCEVAHPNYGGGLGAYGKFNPEKLWWELGTRHAHVNRPLILGPVFGILETFQTYYIRSLPLIKEFAALCERL